MPATCPLRSSGTTTSEHRSPGVWPHGVPAVELSTRVGGDAIAGAADLVAAAPSAHVLAASDGVPPGVTRVAAALFAPAAGDVAAACDCCPPPARPAASAAAARASAADSTRMRGRRSFLPLIPSCPLIGVPGA